MVHPLGNVTVCEPSVDTIIQSVFPLAAVVLGKVTVKEVTFALLELNIRLCIKVSGRPLPHPGQATVTAPVAPLTVIGLVAARLETPELAALPNCVPITKVGVPTTVPVVTAWISIKSPWTTVIVCVGSLQAV